MTERGGFFEYIIKNIYKEGNVMKYVEPKMEIIAMEEKDIQILTDSGLSNGGITNDDPNQVGAGTLN